VLDCSLEHKTNGCGHGWYYYAWDYMVNNSLVSLKDYPYTANVTGSHQDCQVDLTTKGRANTASEHTYTHVTGKNLILRSAVANQPVAVTIDASH